MRPFKAQPTDTEVVVSLAGRPVERGPDPAGLSAREDRFRLEDLRRDDPGACRWSRRSGIRSPARVNQNGVDGLIKGPGRPQQAAGRREQVLKIDADRIDNSKRGPRFFRRVKSAIQGGRLPFRPVQRESDPIRRRWRLLLAWQARRRHGPRPAPSSCKEPPPACAALLRCTAVDALISCPSLQSKRAMVRQALSGRDGARSRQPADRARRVSSVCSAPTGRARRR